MVKSNAVLQLCSGSVVLASMSLALQGYFLTALMLLIATVSLYALLKLNGTRGSQLLIVMAGLFFFAYILKVPWMLLGNFSTLSPPTDIVVNSYEGTDFQTAYALLVVTAVNFTLCYFLIQFNIFFGRRKKIDSIGTLHINGPKQGATSLLFGLFLMVLLLNYYMLAQGWGMLGVPIKEANVFHMVGILTYARKYLIPALLVYVIVKRSISTFDMSIVFLIALISGMAGLSKSLFIVNVAVAFLYYFHVSDKEVKPNYLAIVILSIISISSLQLISIYRSIVYLAADNNVYLGIASQLHLSHEVVTSALGGTGSDLVDEFGTMVSVLFDRVLGFREFLVVFYADHSLSSHFGYVQLLSNIGMDIHNKNAGQLIKDLYGGNVRGGIGIDYLGSVFIFSRTAYILPIIMMVSLLLHTYNQMSLQLAILFKEKAIYYFLIVVMLSVLIDANYALLIKITVLGMLSIVIIRPWLNRPLANGH